MYTTDEFIKTIKNKRSMIHRTEHSLYKHMLRKHVL